MKSKSMSKAIFGRAITITIQRERLLFFVASIYDGFLSEHTTR